MITIEEIATQIAVDCDANYDNGPGDGAEPCQSSEEFADYWLSGDASRLIRLAATHSGFNVDQLWAATEAALQEIYDPARHSS